jgi:hypothetical protein
MESIAISLTVMMMCVGKLRGENDIKKNSENLSEAVIAYQLTLHELIQLPT